MFIKLCLVSIGKNLPSWINDGFNEYTKRLPPHFSLDLIEISPLGRPRGYDVVRIKQQEGQKLLATVRKQDLVVALDEHGQEWSTYELMQHLQQWQVNWRRVIFLVGGPDGLSPECLSAAHVRWSLSKLTLPHALVRVVFAEQIYRTWSIINHHPYHKS